MIYRNINDTYNGMYFTKNRSSGSKLFYLVLLFMLMLNLACAESEESEAPTELVEDIQISNREDALNFLRSIGMSVFTDDAVTAPEFNTVDLEGNERQFSEFAGKVIMLNFWATWCGPCKFELPTMDALYKDLKNENFVMIAMNQLEGQEIVQDYIETEGYSFPVFFDSDGIISFQYGVRGIPTTYIIGIDGKIIAGKVGTHLYDGEVYRRVFRALMN